MQSKMCQIAACLVPKFKLNWVTQERNGIKNTFIEAVVDYSTTEINSQEYNLQSTSSALSRECPSTNSDSEDDFFSFGENSSDTNVNIKLLVNNYLSNGNLKSPLEIPIILKDMYIKYNTAVPSSAHVERLFSAGGQLLSKRRGSMVDQNFEMSLLMKFNRYFD
ncbi:Hypothetical protein CINCED_3A004924 [Cinara cedri]|nr:Hypothetical protein CINCED_3A004924 [Cinara cedri]